MPTPLHHKTRLDVYKSTVRLGRPVNVGVTAIELYGPAVFQLQGSWHGGRGVG